MGYRSQSGKESDITEQLTLSLSLFMFNKHLHFIHMSNRHLCLQRTICGKQSSRREVNHTNRKRYEPGLTQLPT